MTRERRLRQSAICGAVLALSLACPQPALGQGFGNPASPPEFRRATSTPLGDTGIGFLPIAEVILPGQVGVIGSVVNLDFRPGSTDVTHFGAGATISLKHAELFGVWRIDSRIDRDADPLFGNGPLGGIVNDYPLVARPWGEGRGDAFVGVKFNVWSQAAGRPVAIALRPVVKLPTGAAALGVSTGKPDLSVDVVVSQEANDLAYEWTLVAGYVTRGNPDGVVISDGIRWGAGIALPSRRAYRLIVEAHGEWYLDPLDIVIVSHPPPALASVPIPAVNPQTDPVNLSVGFDWLARHGLFVGAAVQFNLNQPGVTFGSKVGCLGRVGFHPGILMPRAPR